MQYSAEYWMRMALDHAGIAGTRDEVPVGAVIVRDDQLISVGYNQKELTNDPTQHAEIVAIKSACQVLNCWRLNECAMYVTLEPCLMCAGAIQQARLAKVFFGAHDIKSGACGSLYHVHNDPRLNHRFTVHAGILAEESRLLLKDFFVRKRPLPKTAVSQTS